MVTKKTTTTTKSPKKTKAVAASKPKKEAAPKVHKEPKTEVSSEILETAAPVQTKAEHLPKGKYLYATGRRKTSVANVRLFSGTGEQTVNKKPLGTYFEYKHYQEEILRPFQVTGLGNDYHFISSINGGGQHSQATALQHGIASALSLISPEVRKVLKKNGLLTRDDRKKERKKPGLKRARRSPQWAKR
jgi:small subunit ribosomal protein S9